MATISVSDFVEGKRTTDLDLGKAGKLTVTYDPNKLTAALDAKMKRAAERNDPDVIAKGLCQVILDWEMTGPLMGERVKLDADGDPELDDDGDEIYEEYQAVAPGEIVPLEPEVMRHLRTVNLVDILNAINRDSFELDPRKRGGSRKR